MIKFLRIKSKKTGLPPGTMVHVGEDSAVETVISIIDYDKDNFAQTKVNSINDILKLRDTNTIKWVNIEGLKNIELIESIGHSFNVHPLVLEDIVNVHQRPKFEEYDNYLFIVLKSISLHSKEFSVSHDQVSILLFNNIVFTLKEKHDDIFIPLLQRIENSKGKIRAFGSDYLVYTIIDTLVDQNFLILDALDEIVDSVEEELLANTTKETLSSIQKIKRELIYIRKSVSPLREMLTSLLRSESDLISEQIEIYFRDVYDHAIRINESIESYRDMLSGLLDVYMSNVSNKMNEVMKVLTIFAAIFIPLTFIAGLYGMNFQFMPELEWHWGYFTVLLFMALVGASMLVYFRRKRWL